MARPKRKPPKKTSSRGSKKSRPVKVSSEPAKKRQRRDVSARKKKAKEANLVARKMPLKKFCKTEALGLAWDDAVCTMNRVVAEAWNLANYVVLWLIEKNCAVPTLDHAFFRKCMVSVSKKGDIGQGIGFVFEKAMRRRRLKQQSVCTMEQWSDFEFYRAVLDYLRLRQDTPLIDCEHICLGWFAEAANKMALNTKNSMWMNLGRRLRQYVKAHYPAACADAASITSCVLSPDAKTSLCSRCKARKRKKKPPFENCTSCKTLKKIVDEIRPTIPRKENGKVAWHSTEIVKLFAKYLTEIEHFNDNHATDPDVNLERTYTVLPSKRGFRCSYFDVTSTGLGDLLRRSRDRMDRNMLAMTVETPQGGVISLSDSMRGRTWKPELAALWWRRLFAVDDLEATDAQGMKRLSFYNRIATDGNGVSVIFEKPVKKPTKDSNAYSLENYDNIKGSDPGYTDMFVACSYDTHTEEISNEFISYPASKFYSNSGYTSSNRYSQRKINRASDVKTIMHHMPSSKTASLSKLRAYLQYTTPHLQKLLQFFMRSNYRGMRFRRYMLAERNLRRACRELAGPPGQRTLVVTGDLDVSNKSGAIKKVTPGPVKRLLRKLSEYCDVMIVDEYKTSQIHHDCDNPESMVNQQVQRRFRRDGKLHTVSVHKVLHCKKSNGGCGATVNRDVNASLNILEVGLTRLREGADARPERLRRPANDDNNASQPAVRARTN